MSKKDLPKSQVDAAESLWQPSIDAQLRLEDEFVAEETPQAATGDWLAAVLAEFGVSPPVEMVADHFNELDEVGQEGLFGELNDACGYDFSVEVVTLAKKKRLAEVEKAGGGSGAAS